MDITDVKCTYNVNIIYTRVLAASVANAHQCICIKTRKLAKIFRANSKTFLLVSA